VTGMKLIAIFIYYTVMHDKFNNSSKLPVSAYIQVIIRPRRYLKLTKNSPYINLGERSHSLFTNVIKIVTDGVKVVDENLYIKKNV
jgi:hypothetical protein